MKTTLVLIHYGELALKGKNRRWFENCLMDNIAMRLRKVTPAVPVVVQRHFGRLLVRFAEPVEFASVQEALGQVFGISSFSPCVVLSRDLVTISQAALVALEGREFNSFAVRARRVDRSFHLTSADINREVGASIVAAFHRRVDLEHPECTVFIEVMHDGVFLATDKLAGLRGLPVGCSAKVLCLVSGGIDSPVAALRMMRRGAPVALLHFHSAPYTGVESQQKMEELAQLLANYQSPVVLYHVALASIQQVIIERAQSKYRILLYRRYMMRIAEAIARLEQAKALVTGDALAQVASQTIENMTAIAQATAMPILRPLLGFDKEEIITEARKFHTFELSIGEGQDCCSFMATRFPAIRARTQDLVIEEKKLASVADLSALVATAVETASKKVFS